MKNIFYILFTAAFFLAACNGNQKKDSGNSKDTTSQNKVQTDKQTDFPLIENLPPGIDTVFGKAPSKEKGFYRFAFPRADLKIINDGVSVDARLAFTTWFSFAPMHNNMQMTMMMGDMVLLETEMPAVEKKLKERDIDITAIHNHLLNEKPKVMYMHVEAMGNPMEIAMKLKEALALTGTPLKAAYNDQSISEDWNDVEKIMSLKGKVNGPVLNFGIPRKEAVLEGDMQLPPGFGISTSLSFQKINDKAAITGDFVLMANEVNSVIKALTDNGITVTAVHNHMLNDNPRLFMLHFWAVGKPEDLAKGLKAALDKTNSKI